jgi:ATP-dependent 26S proteasome regulatory subunit
MDDQKHLEKLIQSGYHCLSIITHEEPYALEVVRLATFNMGRPLWIWSIGTGTRDGLLGGSCPLANTELPETGLQSFAQTDPGCVCVTLDLAEHLKGLTLRMLRDLIAAFEASGSTLIMIDSADKLPEVIRAYARRFEISFPNKAELEDVVRRTLCRLHREKPIRVAVTKKGLDLIVRNLRGLSRRQAERIILDAIAEDRRFEDEDIDVVVASKRQMIQQGGLLEYIRTPQDLNQIGGMRRLKRWLRTRSNVFCSEAEAFGLRPPRGVLLLGVQGAGKSLCAKAIATAWHQPLLRLDPGALYNSFIGESEANLRQVLHQTEAMSPVVLWIDEIEKGFASAASQSTDGGLSKRLFGTLLTWMQEHTAPVFLVATANDIEALPPELLRKGRFDEIFFVDLPIVTVRRQIFSIHLAKRGRDPANFDLDRLAKASEDYSGAEIEEAVISALHEAFTDKTDLDTERLVAALQASPPLSATMAEKVIALREWAKGRCVPAD